MLATDGPFRAGSWRVLDFVVRPSRSMLPGSRLWMFFEFRQDPGWPQHRNPLAANFVSAETRSGSPVSCETYETRTLDLYPRLPEFLLVCEFRFERGLPDGDDVRIHLGSKPSGWQLPRQPIDKFHFWFLESGSAELCFRPTGYKTYREFNTEHPQQLQAAIRDCAISVEGELPRPDAQEARTIPGILWGDIHGMAFNQRPLDDFYTYARDVARLEFAAAMLFSYNVCVEGVWQAVKEAADRWTEPGRFVAIAGVEAGTVPDGSHRNAYFFDARDVPPIFCEDRPPARQARLMQRFSAETVYCDTLDEYYEAVERYGGLVTGHFHTLGYKREVAAEIWQKQLGPEGDEARIFDLLNQGLRLGIVAGSDTHDSMPGNPAPEPYCPQSGGLLAVHGTTTIAAAIRDAILRRRVYGTTGARIGLWFEAGHAPMGSSLAGHIPRDFSIRVEGTAPIERIDLICCGQVVRQFQPDAMSFHTRIFGLEAGPNLEQWYVVKITQQDGHRAWSSPIWFTLG